MGYGARAGGVIRDAFNSAESRSEQIAAQRIHGQSKSATATQMYDLPDHRGVSRIQFDQVVAVTKHRIQTAVLSEGQPAKAHARSRRNCSYQSRGSGNSALWAEFVNAVILSIAYQEVAAGIECDAQWSDAAKTI